MLSLALPGTSWAHRLPVGVKFAALAVIMTLTALMHDPGPLAVLFVMMVALHATLGLRGLRAGAGALRPVVWIVALIALWQILTATPMSALVLALRILAMMGFASFVTLTTPLRDLTGLIERLSAPLAYVGLSPRLPALAVAMVVRFVPVLRGRMDLLGLAWRARSRRRPGPRLIVPMCLSLLDDSDHLADALRARGGLSPHVGGAPQASLPPRKP